MSFYLAIDAGGTKTDYLLADEAHELARSRSGTIKRMRTDASTATENLDSALAEISAKSGISLSSITCTCVGTAGVTVPLVTDWLREALISRISGKLILVGDVEIALDAAFPGGPGVLVLAGTGSNVAGRGPTGVITTAGGWGPALADQGSGHRIGLEALRALFLAIDQGRYTTLLRVLLDAWQLSTIDQMVEMANRIPSPDFSRLTEVVVRSAEQGDAVAAAVLRREGEELAALVCTVIRRLRLTAAEASWLPPLAFAGSIMEKVLLVRRSLIAAVGQEFPGIEVHEGVVDPIAGALWRARTGGLIPKPEDCRLIQFPAKAE